MLTAADAIGAAAVCTTTGADPLEAAARISRIELRIDISAILISFRISWSLDRISVLISWTGPLLLSRIAARSLLSNWDRVLSILDSSSIT